MQGIQEKILLFFQSISSPVLDQAAQLITMLGESTVIVVLLAIIFWCIDKKKGLVISISLLSSLIGMSTLKAIVRQPRPFMVLDSIKGKRLQTATGYSFPSGHTTTASSFYSAVAMNFRKKGLSIVLAILIFLIGISRMYLGVHWPLDVLGGWILGITITFALTSVLEKLFSDSEKTRKFCWITGAVTSVSGLVMGVLVTLNLIDPMAFTDFCKTLGLAGGALFGFILEERFGKFTTDGEFRQKFFRTLIGVLSMLLVRAGLKAVMPSSAVFSFIRYLILGFWTFGCFPVLGVKIKLFQREN